MVSDRELPDTEIAPEPLFQAVNRKLQAELTSTRAQRDALLAALKRMVANAKHRTGDCYSNEYHGVCICGLDAARAAIAACEKGETK